MFPEYSEKISACIGVLEAARNTIAEILDVQVLAGVRSKTTTEIRRIEASLTIGLTSSKSSESDSQPLQRVTKMFGRTVPSKSQEPATEFELQNEGQAAAAQEQGDKANVDSSKEEVTGDDKPNVDNIGKQGLSAEAVELRDKVLRLYPAFSSMKNDEILDSLSELEIRGVGKKAGLPVTETSPKIVDSKFIDQIKKAIAKKNEVDANLQKIELQNEGQAAAAQEQGDKANKKE